MTVLPQLTSSVHWKRFQTPASTMRPAAKSPATMFRQLDAQAIDLSLALIAEDFGQQYALRVARRLLVYLVRDGGQEQYSEPAQFEANNEIVHSQINAGRMQKLVDWIAKHLGDELKVDKLAKRARLTRDELIGQFSQTFGVTPGLFVKNLRFNEARRRLARGEPTVNVAKALGFQETYFTQEFRRRYGALPDEYQRRFGVVSQWDNGGLPEPSSFLSSGREAKRERKMPYQRPKIVSFTRCVRARTECLKFMTLRSAGP
jgi:AraC-like DNA-binding protein